MPKYILGNANFVKKFGKAWTKTKPLNEVSIEEEKLMQELVASGALVKYGVEEKKEENTGTPNAGTPDAAVEQNAGEKVEAAETQLTKQQLRALEKQKAEEAAAAAAAAAGTNTEEAKTE